MIKISDLQVGTKVHYQPSYFAPGEFSNGIVKEIREGREDCVWVVYYCAGNWSRYFDYTGANTSLEDLNLGWL